jgi:hypothetical protein
MSHTYKFDANPVSDGQTLGTSNLRWLFNGKYRGIVEVDFDGMSAGSQMYVMQFYDGITMTADHVLINDMQPIGCNLTYQTSDGELDIYKDDTTTAIPAMKLYFGIKA